MIDKGQSVKVNITRLEDKSAPVYNDRVGTVVLIEDTAYMVKFNDGGITPGWFDEDELVIVREGV